MVPPTIGKVDVLTPVPRVSKIRKYQEDEDKDDTEREQQDSPSEDVVPEPEDLNREQSGDDDQYPHIDDYV